MEGAWRRRVLKEIAIIIVVVLCVKQRLTFAWREIDLKSENLVL